MDVLKAEGKTMWNGETHLPRYFERDAMLDILTKYKVGENRLAAFTLYLNTRGLKREDFIVLDKFDGVKAGFHGFEDAFGYKTKNALLIEKILENKLFLNYNDSGLDEGLKAVLTKKFTDKCRFEN